MKTYWIFLTIVELTLVHFSIVNASVITVAPISSLDARTAADANPPSGDPKTLVDVLGINGIPVANLVLGTTTADFEKHSGHPAAHADNFDLTRYASLDDSTLIETVFSVPVMQIFIMERGANDSGLFQALDVAGSPLGAPLEFGPSDEQFQNDGLKIVNQTAGGFAIDSSSPLGGLRILPLPGRVTGIDPACICAVEAGPQNLAPEVNAGLDQKLINPTVSTSLTGQVSDDGQGDPKGHLSFQWSLIEGPGDIVFEPNAFVLNPTITLAGGTGIYRVELYATDGVLNATDQVTLFLQDPMAVGTLLINEFLADSESEEGGDWIELYNPGVLPVDVAGMYLTDDLQEPQQWQFPLHAGDMTTLAPGGFLHIWTTANNGQTGLHANFKLSADGEAVGLYDRDGLTLIDSILFDDQRNKVSFGREPDGSERWVTLTPTPGQSNHGAHLAFVADTRFDIDRGFFTNPFTLTITCATPGASIAYTTDSSTPSPDHGTLGPNEVTLAIDTTTVVRAMAFKSGMRATNVDTQTYLFLNDVIRQPADIPGYPRPWSYLGGSKYDYHDYQMDPNIVDHPDYRDVIIDSLLAIPTLSLAADFDDFTAVYWASENTEAERPCSMELIFPDDPNDNLQIDCGFNNHSHDRLKRSLRLNFRSEYGAAKLKTTLIQKGSLYGDTATDTFDKLILRGGNNRCWARAWNPDKTTYCIDQFYRDCQVEMTGYGSRGAFVHLYINGLYFGLFNPVERTDHWFTSEYFGGDAQDWFARNHGDGGNLNGDSSRFSYIITTLVNKDLSNPTHYAEMLQYVDVNNFIDYMLFTWWMGVTDWPQNNWYAGIRNESSPLGASPLRFFAWDGEWCWDTKGGNNTATVPSEFRNNTTSSKTIPKIWHALRKNDDFMMLFADHVYRHFYHEGAFTDHAAQERWLAINDLVYEAVVAESARWGDAIKKYDHVTRTRDVDWQREVDDIYNVIDGSRDTFIDNLRQQGYYPNIDPPSFNQRGGAVDSGFAVTLTHPNGSGTIYYTLDGLSDSAVAYSEPIILNETHCIKTRVLQGSTWSALNQTVFSVGPILDNLRISELMYHPTEPNAEFVELLNIGTEAIDLNLIQFTKGIRFTFGPYVLAPDATVLIVRDLDTFASLYGTGLSVAGQYDGVLENGGERLQLVDAVGQIIHDFKYKDTWYDSTDGLGYSLTVREPALAPVSAWNDKRSWKASHLMGGTPGAID